MTITLILKMNFIEHIFTYSVLIAKNIIRLNLKSSQLIKFKKNIYLVVEYYEIYKYNRYTVWTKCRPFTV